MFSEKNRQVAGYLAAVLIVASYVGWHGTWSMREASRWDGCLSKPLAQCRPPSGYIGLSRECAYHDCRTNPPGASYASAHLEDSEGWLAAYAYAVIALDREGRVIKIEIKRFYAAI